MFSFKKQSLAEEDKIKFENQISQVGKTLITN